VRNGWLPAAAYQPRIDQAWRAVLKRTAADGRLVFTAEQGDGLGRPGRLQVELTTQAAQSGHAGHATRVRVGGTAVTVLTGSLRSDA